MIKCEYYRAKIAYNFSSCKNLIKKTFFVDKERFSHETKLNGIDKLNIAKKIEVNSVSSKGSDRFSFF